MKTNLQHYQNELDCYKQWLQRLGYAEATIYGHGKYLHYFFNWLSSQGVSQVHTITTTHIKKYQRYLETRPHQRKPGGLSAGIIYAYMTVIKNFDKYLQQYEKGSLPVKHLQLPEPLKTEKDVLTTEEINQLYEITDNGPIGYRDRAMLSLYYGCGLRRSEGTVLQIEDIDWKRNYLHIRKGKGAKARYVPFNEKIAADLQAYYPHYRNQLLRQATPIFLIGQRGRIQGGSINDRLKLLAERAGINKPVNLHLLRHSIATHLLQKGMDIEQIASFLGHSTLEATQIYTHIAMSTETSGEGGEATQIYTHLQHASGGQARIEHG